MEQDPDQDMEDIFSHETFSELWNDSGIHGVLNMCHQELQESDFLAMQEGNSVPQPVEHGGAFPLPDPPVPTRSPAVPSTEDYAGEHNFELVFESSGMAKSVTCTVRPAGGRVGLESRLPGLSFEP
ncbi:hypothetical protein lerEdw1_006431 [Lerista edwardsae]|nr:hypothetical protein lerEdw1_006431 [Lerista edwardsae]